jgi:hypothetical protein
MSVRPSAKPRRPISNMCKRFPFERYAVFRAAVFLVRLFFLATHKAMGKIYIAKCKLPHTLLPHLRVASIALSSPTILKLLPRPSFPRISPAAGISASSQCRNTAFMSRGTPSMTTVVTGINGRSSSETARMPYSCAKRRAVENAWLCVRDKAPMMLKIH